jgi:hypothetical protein
MREFAKDSSSVKRLGVLTLPLVVENSEPPKK